MIRCRVLVRQRHLDWVAALLGVRVGAADAEASAAPRDRAGRG